MSSIKYKYSIAFGYTFVVREILECVDDVGTFGIFVAKKGDMIFRYFQILNQVFSEFLRI